MNQWYPQDKGKLNEVLDKLLSGKEKSNIHGLIVPHAGYEFSGEIAGKAFSLLKNSKIKKAVVMGPSHYTGFEGAKTLDKLETPLGKVNIIKNNFSSLTYEHSIDNEIPFLQKLGFKEILPLVIGELNKVKAEELAHELAKMKDVIYIFSSDLSHFMEYKQAVKTDKQTIKIIEELDFEKCKEIDACGAYPIGIMMHLCKIKSWKPKLIEYKNSGDITGDKNSVVGYASFSF